MIGTTRFQVTGRLNDDGDASINVTAHCDYGSRTATVSQDITDEKLLSAVAGLFDKAVKQVREDLNQQATSAAAEALVVATKRGEKI